MASEALFMVSLILNAICVGFWTGACLFTKDIKKYSSWLIFSAAVTTLLFLRGIDGSSHNQLYARTAVVTGVDADTDIVTVIDGAGIGWGFYGIEDWDVGDVVSMLMDNNGTPENIFDDKIVKATYAGILGQMNSVWP